MKYLMCGIAVFFVIQTLAIAGDHYGDYFEAGVKFMEQGYWVKAIDEFTNAISLKYKDESLNSAQGYYPHREMGVCLYCLGDVCSSRKELEISTTFAPSQRAHEYLDKINKYGDLEAKVEKNKIDEDRKRIEREKGQLCENLSWLEQRKKARCSRCGGTGLCQQCELEIELEQQKLEKKQKLLAKDEANCTVREREIKIYDLLLDRKDRGAEPQTIRVGGRTSMFVAPFHDASGDSEVASRFNECFIISLSALRRFSIMDMLLNKPEYDRKGNELRMYLPCQAAEIGRELGADLALIGSVSASVRELKIELKLIDTYNGNIIIKRSFRSPKSIDDVVNLADRIARQICQDMPVVRGEVAEYDRDSIVHINMGESMGLHRGMRAIVYQDGETIVHPITGEEVAKEAKKIGEIILVNVNSNKSEASVAKIEPGQCINVGNAVITK